MVLRCLRQSSIELRLLFSLPVETWAPPSAALCQVSDSNGYLLRVHVVEVGGIEPPSEQLLSQPNYSYFGEETLHHFSYTRPGIRASQGGKPE